MRNKYRGKEIEKSKQIILKDLQNLEKDIIKKKVNELKIDDITYSFIILLTETENIEILNKTNEIAEIFLNKINKNINIFETSQLPTLFSILQLFAIESGQYGFETTENPDSRINKIIKKYDNEIELLKAEKKYKNAQTQLKKSIQIRQIAISCILKLFNRNEFCDIKQFVEQELLPLIKTLNDRNLYRPFRVAEATKIGDKIYDFSNRTNNYKLKNLLLSLYSKKQIRFGTSGFRAFINKDFTQYRSDAISLAICDNLKIFQKKNGKTIIITYDTRIGAREFALESAKVFLAQGFTVKFTEHPSPTGSMVYWLIEEEKCDAAGGENMTPSHNPLSTQGQRLNLSNGDVSPTSVTDNIEKSANLINLLCGKIDKKNIKDSKFSYIDIKDKYTDYISNFLKKQEVNILDNNNITLEKKPLTELLKNFYSNIDHKFIHNSMSGACADYISKIFEKIGINVECVFPMNSYKDDFLGLEFYGNPEEKWILKTMKEFELSKSFFETATDTDGDRCGGVLDKKGFINLNKLMAMLEDFVVRGLGWEKCIVIRTCTTSTALDDVITSLKSKGYEICTPEIDHINSLVQHPFYELIKIPDESAIKFQKFPSVVTEVGFKYISAAMKKYDIPASVAGEESGGFAVKKFPDKDGIMGVCLIASMIAWHKKIPNEIWEEHIKKYGKKYDKRSDIWVSNIPKQKIINSWFDNSITEIAKQKIIWLGGIKYDKIEIVLNDGFDNISRVLIRASATEEINRIYIESFDEKILENIQKFIIDKLNNMILNDISCTENYYDLANKISSNSVIFMNKIDKKTYFDTIKNKMKKLAQSQKIEPIEIYRKVLKLLTIDIDRDINIRHKSYGIDIGMEYYIHIF